jgi:WD40 repeat protein
MDKLSPCLLMWIVALLVYPCTSQWYYVGGTTHSDDVTEVDFAPDGGWFVVASNDLYHCVYQALTFN